MKIKAIAEACMWLPGFAPEEDPLVVLGPVGSARCAATDDAPASVSAVGGSTIEKRATWPALRASDLADLSGPVGKFEANVKAITLLRELEHEGREPSPDERTTLNRFTGWGGLPQAFNPSQSDTAWAARSVQLAQLLTPEEYKSAHDSTPNSHYTPVEVVSAMWSAVKALGFQGGRIVEPSCGNGYFLGAMPEDVASMSTVTAVELDSIPSRIARALYGPYGAVVRHGGFESTQLPLGFYDLAIGNPPFGNYQAAERRNVPFANFSVHNYFIARALELVRPGGMVAFITSSFTLDATEGKVRKYLAGQAELVTAIRLPCSTFKSIAGTEVTTDILIFKKRVEPQRAEEQPIWVEQGSVTWGSKLRDVSSYDPKPFGVNKFYEVNPENVIGTLSVRQLGARRVTVCSYDGDANAALVALVERLPKGVYQPQVQGGSKATTAQQSVELEGKHRPGLVVIDGKVFEVVGSKAVPCALSGKSLERVLGLVQLRDAARKLISAQTGSDDDEMVGVYRTALNIAYDAFVSKHGYVNDKANRRVFKVDPDLPLLLSLEVWDEETRSAGKAAIFTRRTAGSHKRVESCSTAIEAMQVSLGETARVVPARIAELVGKPADVVMAELEEGGHVFLNPESGHWEHSDVYLSGLVRDKLAAAQSCGPRFEGNVKALESVIPPPLLPQDITARIGSTWIPASVYAMFLENLLGKKGFTVSYEPTVGTWNVSAPWISDRDMLNTQTHGTERANAVELFAMELNQRKPTVFDKDASGKPVANQAATIEAREKQHELKEKFTTWIWSDKDRSAEMAGLYNAMFNATVPRRFNGEHLVLPGMSSAFTLRPHQRDAIWRIVSSQYPTLLAHAVGAGKTLEMICGGAELRRLGQASKVMHVVPNHMLYAYGAAFMSAYPHAHVLIASKEDLQGERRKLLLSRIATCDWDAVIVTQATFESIRVSDDYMASYIECELDKIEQAIRLHGDDRKNSIVKQLARAKKSWRTKLEKLNNTCKKADLLDFEELGVDWLMVDEAHWGKNLGRFSKMERIAGLSNTSSERAFDLFVKTRCVMERRGDSRGVTFATATPITNSIAEAYTMMRYLEQDVLERHQIDNFDSWVANFAEPVTALELAPDGSGYRMQTRLSRFVNLPELMALFHLVADIRTADMLDLPTPKARKETVTVDGSEDLKAFVAELVERAEKIRSGGVKPSTDNMLKITSDGRKAALDMRLVDPMAPQQEDGKIQTCARNVHRIWMDSTDVRGVQVVFCDLSTPRRDGAFSAYDSLRQSLVSMGIPAHEIAYIHDHESDTSKDALFKSLRQGAVRVVLGSTEKLGVGTNIQDRLIALHHLDSPWRPSDLEQREGRIVRQGNMFDEVFIYTYITRGSFDAYMYQILHSKGIFIAQVMAGNAALRTVEDAELAALSYAEIKALASGNPLVLKKAGVDNELAKLAILRQEWLKRKKANERDIEVIPDAITRARRAISAHEKDIESLAAWQRPATVTVGGRAFTDMSAAAKELTIAMRCLTARTAVIGAYNGFKMHVAQRSETQMDVWLEGAWDYSLGTFTRGSQVLQAAHDVMRPDVLQGFMSKLNSRIAYLKAQIHELQLAVLAPFDKQDRFDELRKQQIEIDALLDLSKGEMSAVEESATAEDAMSV